MTDNDRISLRDGWLAAQFLKHFKGNRNKFRIGRDNFTIRTIVAARIPDHSADWAPIISLVEQRTQEGDVGILAFDEPITDEVFLQYLRLHGIHVYPSFQDYTLLPNGLSFGF